MGGTNEPDRKQPPHPPPAVPWIQALALVVLVAVVAVDAFGPPDFSPPREIYALIGAAIIGLGPDSAVELVAAWRRKGP